MNFPEQVITDLHILSIPLKHQFRGIDYREVALFRGPQGWSEFSPFLEYETVEASHWLKAAVLAAHQPWPTQFRTKVQVNATLPQVNVEEVPGVLANYPGCTAIKIKVDGFEDGAELIEAALNEIPDAKIRLDVNGGWSLEAALLHLYDYNLRFGNIFEYIEQPCASSSELAKLKREMPFKIAVDEAIRKNLNTDLHELSEIADVAILKWAPVGGMESAHEIASRIGLPVVISSALDTGIGISHSLALAGSFQRLDYACGLGTTSLFVEDICAPSSLVQDGALTIERRNPIPELLVKYQANTSRIEWWRNRIANIWNECEGSSWL